MKAHMHLHNGTPTLFLDEKPTYWAPFMHLTDFTHPITRGIPQDLFWGTTRSLAPIFHLEDPEAAHRNPDAAILGEVVYGLGRCKPGLGVKQINSGSDRSWNSVYVATPNLPPQLLRGIARFAGVHLYSEDGDVLYATRELLSVHTVGGGPWNFRLPQKVEVVYDLFEMREVARDAEAFDVALAPASTRLFYTGEVGLLNLLMGRGLQSAQIGLQSAQIGLQSAQIGLQSAQISG